jgi:hypothetical protein
MRLLICGSRNWADSEYILDTLLHYHPDVVIEGGAKGADLLAADVARKLGIEVVEFVAEWSKHGKAAGPIRNQRMLDEGHPDFVLAFHDDYEHSKGTKDMITRSYRAGLPFRVCTHGIRPF